MPSSANAHLIWQPDRQETLVRTEGGSRRSEIPCSRGNDVRPTSSPMTYSRIVSPPTKTQRRFSVRPRTALHKTYEEFVFHARAPSVT